MTNELSDSPLVQYGKNFYCQCQSLLCPTFSNLSPFTSCYILGPSIIFCRLVYIWKLSLIRFWSREYPRNGFDIKQTTDVGNEDMHD